MNKSLSSAEETIQLGEALSLEFFPNLVLALFGNLGAGKTTFVQGVLQGLKVKDRAQSPTFSLLNIYDAKVPIFHFDLYRLKNVEEFISLGFEEYFEAGGICIIEWAERILPILPKNHWRLELKENGAARDATLWR